MAKTKKVAYEAPRLVTYGRLKGLAGANKATLPTPQPPVVSR
jgi:hypothetical protein